METRFVDNPFWQRAFEKQVSATFYPVCVDWGDQVSAFKLYSLDPCMTAHFVFCAVLVILTSEEAS